MFIVRQPRQEFANRSGDDGKYVRLLQHNLGADRNAQTANGVITPDAAAWTPRKYNLGDQVTGTDGLVYQYVYPNEGNPGTTGMPDGDNYVRSLNEIAAETGLLSTFRDTSVPQPDFYKLQNPVKVRPLNPPVPGSAVVDAVTFWEVARAINSRALLDGRPSIATGRAGESIYKFAMNFLPDTIGIIGVVCDSVRAYFQNNETGFRVINGGSLEPGTTNPFFTDYTPDVAHEKTDMLITNIRDTAPFGLSRGEIFITLRITRSTGVDNLPSSVGQVIFGNREFAGDLIPGSSSQSTVDFSEKERNFEGLLNVTPRYFALRSTQRISYPILETNRVKRLTTSLLPAVPALFYESEDIRLGSLLYGVMDNVKFNYPDENVTEGQATLALSGLV